MDKLYLIEGLPGTGKTTYCHKLLANLQNRGYQVTLLEEEDSRIPTNFYHVAVLEEAEYMQLKADLLKIVDQLKMVDQLKDADQLKAVNQLKAEDQLKAATMQVEEYYIIRIDDAPKEIREDLLTYDIGNEFNTRFDAKTYIKLGLLLISKSLSELTKMDGIIIIDSGFLQNPLNEVLFRKGTDGHAFRYAQGIAQRYLAYNPMCVYLNRNDVEVSMEFARKSKGEDWYERILELEKKTGSRDHFNHRYMLERTILNSNLIPWTDYILEGTAN